LELEVLLLYGADELYDVDEDGNVLIAAFEKSSERASTEELP
jgi:hypothetical protein